MPRICFLCTGNAARSVMAAAFFAAAVPDWEVDSAGTHSIDGQPMSWRTRDALAHLGYAAPGHRSRQFGTDHLASDLIVGFEPAHVAWIRREHPGVAARTGTIRRLVEALPTTSGAFSLRLSQLGLDTAVLEAREEVTDPAGADAAGVIACAEEVHRLTAALAAAITETPVPPPCVSK